MTTFILLRTMLTFHLIGVVLFVGTTVSDFLAYNQFWKYHDHDQSKARLLVQSVSRFPVAMRVGIITIIISAVAMMALTNGAYGEQVWLRVKFAIVILAILHGAIVGRRLLLLLKRLIDNNEPMAPASLLKLKRNFRFFHLVQFTFFVAILLLSVFKFN